MKYAILEFYVERTMLWLPGKKVWDGMKYECENETPTTRMSCGEDKSLFVISIATEVGTFRKIDCQFCKNHFG